MDTRSSLRNVCVYCGGGAETKDHAPPRCLLRRPLPSNLITLPSCTACNSGFSFAENVVKTVLTLTSGHPELAAERQPDGRVHRALARDAKLRSIVEGSRRPDGNFELAGEMGEYFERVFRKTAQGLFFGLYDRVIPSKKIQVL